MARIEKSAQGVIALVMMCGVMVTSSLFAVPSGTVIQISSKLRMSSTEGPPEKDYFVDLGTRAGVKVGDVFDVFRPYSVVDNSTGEIADVLSIGLGELKVFLVGEYSSVARVSSSRELRDLPALEYSSIMLGDQVQLKTSLPLQGVTP